MNDLSDVLSGSGVDLREEETLLNRLSSSAQVQPTAQSHDQQALHSSNDYQTPYASFPSLSPNLPGDRQSFFGAGTFNQAPISHKTLEQQAEEKRKRRLRVRAEIRSFEMNEPFLQGAILNLRLNRSMQQENVRLHESDGQVKVLPPGDLAPKRVLVVGPDNNERLCVLTHEEILVASSRADVLSLLSLATRERLKAVLEDAIAMARGRKLGARGTVPPEFAGIATGNGLPKPTSSSPGNPRKRTFPGPVAVLKLMMHRILLQSALHDRQSTFRFRPTK